MTTSIPDLGQLAALGLRWRDAGQAGYTGAIGRLQNSLDLAFGSVLAALWSAEDERHPATMSADDLERLGYLRSFPHQATFAVALDDAAGNIDEFLAGPVVADGVAVLTRTTPPAEILTPAACYHCYLAHTGERQTGPRYLTTRNTCFRREQYYEPLRRQWSFSMREIICLADADTTAAFLRTAQDAISRFAALAGLPLTWETATDPFFRPDTDPRHLLQKVLPIKHEATYGDLAIASVNRHFEHFGELADIELDGRPIDSACTAFGLDRWVFAIIDHFGPDPAAWPDPVAVAERVVHDVREER